MSRESMKLKDIPQGIEIFIDANIFIYHFTGNSAECSEVLARCENGELNGVTSAIVAAEVMHRMMLAEASLKKLARAPQIVKKLKERPEIVCRLADYFVAVQAIFEIGIKVYPMTPELILNSQAIRSRYGLMVNDSLIAATMRDIGVEAIATNDDGFSRVDWIKVYKPGDL
jgi:predicted nucleic acid-binding protein